MTERSAGLLHRFRRWLSPADAPRTGDLIFVLAGRMNRKDYALNLFRQGLAPRVLLSVGRFEIRRFSKMQLPVPLDLLKMAQELPPPRRHYFACFEGQEVTAEYVPPGSFGTLTEIRALARWLGERPEIRSVLVVSSDTHLRRIRMCCRALLDPKLELAFLATPTSRAEPPATTLEEDRPSMVTTERNRNSGMLTGAALELFKLSIYWTLLKFL